MGPPANAEYSLMYVLLFGDPFFKLSRGSAATLLYFQTLRNENEIALARVIILVYERSTFDFLELNYGSLYRAIIKLLEVKMRLLLGES